MAIMVIKMGQKPAEEKPPADAVMRGTCRMCQTEVECLGGDAMVHHLRPSLVRVIVACPTCGQPIPVQSDPPWIHPRGLPVNVV